MEQIIYLLVDPITGAPRYVGQTSKTEEERIAAHVHTAEENMEAGHPTEKDRWILKLYDTDRLPQAIRLASVDRCSADAVEYAFIKLFFGKMNPHDQPGLNSPGELAMLRARLQDRTKWYDLTNEAWARRQDHAD